MRSTPYTSWWSRCGSWGAGELKPEAVSEAIQRYEIDGERDSPFLFDKKGASIARTGASEEAEERAAAEAEEESRATDPDA